MNKINGIREVKTSKWIELRDCIEIKTVISCYSNILLFFSKFTCCKNDYTTLYLLRKDKKMLF